MDSVKFLILALLLATGSACSSYKHRDRGMSKVGYSENKIAENTYELSYYGSGFHSHEDVTKLWHRRASELCSGHRYHSSTEKTQWTFDAYTVLPPFLLVGNATAPSIKGTLRCNS